MRARLVLLITTARIFSVIDVSDALRSDRPYRAAWEQTKVLAHIREQSGRLFDPRVVEAFFSLLAEPDLNESNYSLR